MNNDDILSLERVYASLKRGKKLIAFSTLFSLLLAVLYISFTARQYTAITSILLDPAQAQTVSEISAKAQRGFEDQQIFSELEVLKSRRVAEKAMEYLLPRQELIKLENDFVDRERKLTALRSGLYVYREGQSYVLVLHYVHTDPEEAAKRANAFARAFTYEQINAFSEGSEKTVDWLKNKIEELRENSVEAYEAVQAFRVRHNLINSGGSTVNEQQLSNMNTQLSNAKAATATARARYYHAEEIIKKNDISAAVAEAFDNDVINNVRAQYIDGQQRLLKLIRTLGEDHQAVISLRQEQEEARNVIFTEMKRITQSFKNEYEVLKTREQSLEESLTALISQKIENDKLAFELLALEKEAESFQALYNDYLEKFEIIGQQESFPVSESRILSEAVRPLESSHPKTFLIIGMALIVGVGLGVFLALLVDNFDKSFKRAGQVEKTTGLFFLGFLPKFDSHFRSHSKNSSAKSALFQEFEYRQSYDVPLSLYAETSRHIKIAIDKRRQTNCHVLGVTSDILNNGKLVTITNLAIYLAGQGSKTLLIDADLRNPSLSKQNFKSYEYSLQDALEARDEAKSIFLQDPETGLCVLPSREFRNQSNRGLYNIENFKAVINTYKKEFEHIILDLPPLGTTSDLASFGSVVDDYLLALVWSFSRPNKLNFYLKQNGLEKSKILGAVLCEADMKCMVQNYGHDIYPEYTTIT
nr:AAA family ATPase [Cytophagales bacterium]